MAGPFSFWTGTPWGVIGRRSAISYRLGPTLAQRAADDQTKGDHCLQEVLHHLALEGRRITGDALFSHWVRDVTFDSE